MACKKFQAAESTLIESAHVNERWRELATDLEAVDAKV